MSEDTADEQRMLAERARLLARPRTDPDALGGARTYAMFARGGLRYAIDPRYVLEAARVLAPTPLPRTAPHWLGVSSLRGELLAVVDLPVLLGGLREAAPAHASSGDALDDEEARETSEPERQLVLVLGRARTELALQIDEVLEARVIHEQLALAPHTDLSTSRLVLGTTAEGVRVVIAEAVLADPRLWLADNNLSEA